MNEAALALGMAALIFAASVVSIRAAVSVAIVEIVAGVIGGQFHGKLLPPAVPAPEGGG